MEKLGKFVAWVMSYVAHMLARGFAIVYLWKWFVIPLGVVPISFWWGMGLSVVFSIFMPKPSLEKGSDDERQEDFRKSMTDMVAEITTSVALLGMGWVIQCFM